jgi:hypothetical protein
MYINEPILKFRVLNRIAFACNAFCSSGSNRGEAMGTNLPKATLAAAEITILATAFMHSKFQ